MNLDLILIPTLEPYNQHTCTVHVLYTITVPSVYTKLTPKLMTTAYVHVHQLVIEHWSGDPEVAG